MKDSGPRKNRGHVNGKMLVIDDEVIIRKMFRRLFLKEGYRVVGAANGTMGLKYMRKVKPDLVILDLRMPGMDGIEVLKAIKRINQDVVVIVLTGYGTLEIAGQAMKLGAHDFIAKPFDLTRMRVSVKNALEMQRLSREVAEAKAKLKVKTEKRR